jgi:hypothetical protein
VQLYKSERSSRGRACATRKSQLEIKPQPTTSTTTLSTSFIQLLAFFLPAFNIDIISRLLAENSTECNENFMDVFDFIMIYRQLGITQTPSIY